MRWMASVFCWMELLGLALWIGGMVTIGALVAPTVFAELGSETGGQVMTLVFRKFNGGHVYISIVLVAFGYLGKTLLHRVPGRARWIEGGVLIVMIVIGLYIGALLGPKMQALRQEKIANPNNNEAREAFTRNHHVSRNLFSVNMTLGIAVLFFNAREMSRRRES
jgi:uncharacterized membrane protein